MFERTLRTIRENLRLSKSELARRVGVNQSMIRLYEDGKSVPSVLIAVRYADELNITISELIQLLKKGA